MNLQNQIVITETPRDAMQGWPKHIPQELKAKYINALIRVGFHTIDCGSFVSAQAIPQMADTAKVLSLVEPESAGTKLMVLVGNKRGGLNASTDDKIQIIGFPYSVSETFLLKNLNTTKENAMETILELKNICLNSDKELRVYVAMAFGNPYGDSYNNDTVISEVEKLCKAGISDIVFSDITGEGSPESIGMLCRELLDIFPGMNPGIHLHSRPEESMVKVESAWDSGIRRFESAIGGHGGCPMTGYELLANTDTLELAGWCNSRKILTGLNEAVLNKAQQISYEIFN